MLPSVGAILTARLCVPFFLGLSVCLLTLPACLACFLLNPLEPAIWIVVGFFQSGFIY